MTPLIRTPRRDELDALAAFIAGLNRRPEHRCLNCDEEPGGVRRELDGFAVPPEAAFAVALEDGELAGALGCDADPELGRGWLWGPFIRHELWEELAPLLLDRLLVLLPATVRQLDAFSDAANARAHRFYLDSGFEEVKRTHVYIAPRPPSPIVLAEPCGELEDAHVEAFLALHAQSFPRAPKPGQRLLAERGADKKLFAATEGPRLLGYLHATLGDAPVEGFVEYLAVHPEARGRGVGRLLLLAALHWFFEVERMPQAALGVDDSNTNARNLYERVGFTLRYSGVVARFVRG